MMPAPMYLRRNSSSETLCGMSLLTSFSICGMNQMRISVLVTLNMVWNVASTKVRRSGFSTPASASTPTRRQAVRTKG